MFQSLCSDAVLVPLERASWGCWDVPTPPWDSKSSFRGLLSTRQQQDSVNSPSREHIGRKWCRFSQLTQLPALEHSDMDLLLHVFLLDEARILVQKSGKVIQSKYRPPREEGAEKPSSLSE